MKAMQTTRILDPKAIRAIQGETQQDRVSNELFGARRGIQDVA